MRFAVEFSWAAAVRGRYVWPMVSPAPTPRRQEQAEPAGRSWRIVVLGRSITSSWGHGHASTYRGLLSALHARGHEVTFLERDDAEAAARRDVQTLPYCRIGRYGSLDELAAKYEWQMAEADAVIVGSGLRDGIAIGEFVTALAPPVCAFYDLDSPMTVEDLVRGRCESVSAELIREYDLYLACTAGPYVIAMEEKFGSPMARALWCSVDANAYEPQAVDVRWDARWDLGLLANFSADRRAPLERFLLGPARLWPQGRFVVAGPHWPDEIDWPANVQRIEYIAPEHHRDFYTQCRFALNLTRADRRVAGYSPSARLFEAAACATPVVSDDWPGLGDVFEPSREIVVATSRQEVLDVVRETSQEQRNAMGEAARQRFLAEHTADRRAIQLEQYLAVLDGQTAVRSESGERTHG